MMKNSKIFTALVFVFCIVLSLSVMAQNEQKGFSFQGYARDFEGGAYSGQTITAQFSIYPEGEAIEYTEQHTLATDAFGVFHAEVGSITPVNFASLDFSSKKYFMRVEVKVSGGDFVEISNTELLAVPYAKAAETAVSAQNAVSSNNGNPPGVILPFAGAPGNIPAGYLACDGSSVLVADYPELYAAIGDAWGGDGGTNFNLPDLRGQFMRGLDNGAGVDPDASGRMAMNTGGNTGDAVGSYQTDAFQDHSHGIVQGTGTINLGNFVPAIDDDNYGINSSTDTANSGRTSTETRPVNASVFFMIKY